MVNVSIFQAIDRVFYRVGDYADFYKASVADEADASFFVFPTCRRDPLNIDYKNVYNASGWKIVRYRIPSLIYYLDCLHLSTLGFQIFSIPMANAA